MESNRTLRRAGSGPAPTFNIEEAARFLALLDSERDTHIFARGDDDRERRKRLVEEAAAAGRSGPSLWEQRFGSLESSRLWLEERQAGGWGTFVAVQAMQGANCRSSDVVYIRAVFAEMDIGVPLVPWPIPPSLVVETSAGRFHAYWLVAPDSPITPDDFDGVERRLVETYGSDPNSKDRARRLRLPGSWNVKPDRPAHLVTIVEATSARYSGADLLQAFPPLPARERASAIGRRPNWGGSSGLGSLDRFVGRNKEGPLWAISPDRYSDWVGVGMALHAESNGGPDGLALWDSWSAQSQKWSPGVCTIRWGSFGGRKGITGGTIYALAEERGWSKPLRSMDHLARAPHVAQRIHGATQAAAPVPNGTNASPPPAASPKEVALTDFYAHMPSGDFIFIPGRDFWPARSVDARIPRETTSAAEGHQATIKASAWIAKYRPVEQITWAPGRPELIADVLVTEGGFIPQPGRSVFNLYRPPLLELGDAKVAGQWLDHLMRVYPSDWSHILNWLAHRVQRAGEKINHALVLGGAPGIGKDTLLHPAIQAVGPWNVDEVSPSQLMGTFNGYYKSVILRVSEAHDLGEIDRYALYERTKTLLAAPPAVLRVNEKNRREYAVPNVVGVIYTTNHRTNSLYLPADDRRHYVAWSEATKEDFSQEYWEAQWAWYKEGGSGHVAAYLSSLDIGSFSATAPPAKTTAFWAIAHADRSSDEAELADVIDALGKPVALCVSHLVAKAEALSMSALAEGLKDHKGKRNIGHRLERSGYISVDSDTKDGHWVVNKRRQRVYARQDLGPGDRKTAAEMLANKFHGSLSELAAWAAGRVLNP